MIIKYKDIIIRTTQKCLIAKITKTDALNYISEIENQYNRENDIKAYIDTINNTDDDNLYIDLYAIATDEKILIKTNVEVKHYEVNGEDDIKEIKTVIPEFVQLRCFPFKNNIPSAECSESHDDARYAIASPRIYRKIKCKECGLISYIPIDEDGWFEARNLKKPQRCSICRSIKYAY